MATNPNMVAIQTSTVEAGGAAFIEFTNIPQTYTDLILRLSARTSNNDSLHYGSIFITINSNTNGIYDNRRINAYSSTVNSYFDVNQSTFITVGAGSSATANTFSNNEFYFSNYTSNNNKSISVDYGVETNDTSNNLLSFGALLFKSSSPITSIKLAATSGQTIVQHSTATLYGVSSASIGAKATGGAISSDATYWYHTFTSSGTFTPTQSLTADYLVVAGGGGGGGDQGTPGGGGGGAGGLRCTVGATGGGGSLESTLSLNANSNYTVTVGGGGAGGSGSGSRGTQGTSSVFSSVSTTGGGGGGSYNGANTGGSGGSGGGGAIQAAGGSGTVNEGYDGATPTFDQGGGGGGGAGAVGGSDAAGRGGNGGIGIATSISGTSTYYGGGGGGGGGYYQLYNGGSGGNGGGGAGGFAQNYGEQNGTSGTTNTGGGGGGSGGHPTGGGVGYQSSTGGSGGSGIVIIRYAK